MSNPIDSLHAAIMNIQAPATVEAMGYADRFAYKSGHRDARHAAAELALAAEAKLAASLATTEKMAAELEARLTEILRFKSTNAPRLEALQGLLETSQREAAAGAEAIATLSGERAANAILTGEVEALRKDAERYRKLRAQKHAMCPRVP